MIFCSNNTTPKKGMVENISNFSINSSEGDKTKYEYDFSKEHHNFSEDIKESSDDEELYNQSKESYDSDDSFSDEDITSEEEKRIRQGLSEEEISEEDKSSLFNKLQKNSSQIQQKLQAQARKFNKEPKYIPKMHETLKDLSTNNQNMELFCKNQFIVTLPKNYLTCKNVEYKVIDDKQTSLRITATDKNGNYIDIIIKENNLNIYNHLNTNLEKLGICIYSNNQTSKFNPDEAFKNIEIKEKEQRMNESVYAVFNSQNYQINSQYNITIGTESADKMDESTRIENNNSSNILEESTYEINNVLSKISESTQINKSNISQNGNIVPMNESTNTEQSVYSTRKFNRSKSFSLVSTKDSDNYIHHNNNINSNTSNNPTNHQNSNTSDNPTNHQSKSYHIEIIFFILGFLIYKSFFDSNKVKEEAIQHNKKEDIQPEIINPKFFKNDNVLNTPEYSTEIITNNATIITDQQNNPQNNTEIANNNQKTSIMSGLIFRIKQKLNY